MLARFAGVRHAIAFIAILLFCTSLHASNIEACSEHLHAQYELALLREVKLHVLRAWDSSNRLRKSLTQRHLAEKLNTSPATVNKLLNNMEGSPWTMHRLVKVAELLDVPIETVIPTRLAHQIEPPLVPGLNEDPRPDTETELLIRVFYLERGVLVERDQIRELVADVDDASRAMKRRVDPALIQQVLLHRALNEVE